MIRNSNISSNDLCFIYSQLLINYGKCGKNSAEIFSDSMCDRCDGGHDYIRAFQTNF